MIWACALAALGAGAWYAFRQRRQANQRQSAGVPERMDVKRYASMVFVGDQIVEAFATPFLRGAVYWFHRDRGLSHAQALALASEATALPSLGHIQITDKAGAIVRSLNLEVGR